MLPSAGTSLERIETNQHGDTTSDYTTACTPPDVGCIFRHSGWNRLRSRVREALAAVFFEGDRLDHFDQCGRNAWVLADSDNPDRLRVVGDYCHDRWCMPCSAARSRLIAANLRARVADRAHRFITLTLRHTEEDLRKRVRFLYASFTRLRRSRFWKSRIKGGAAFCEITRNRQTKAWHVHLHIVADGSFADQASLSDAWTRASRGSFIVDIRMIRDAETTVRYVCKYAAKGISSASLGDAETLQQAMRALSGVRLCLTFGTWRGVSLTEVNDLTEWKCLGTLREFLDREDGDDVQAVHVLSLLRDRLIWLDRPPPDPELWND